MGLKNNWYQSYNCTIIEIGAQKPQSGPIAWPKFTCSMDVNPQTKDNNNYYLGAQRVKILVSKRFLFPSMYLEKNLFSKEEHV